MARNEGFRQVRKVTLKGRCAKIKLPHNFSYICTFTWLRFTRIEKQIWIIEKIWNIKILVRSEETKTQWIIKWNNYVKNLLNIEYH